MAWIVRASLALILCAPIAAAAQTAPLARPVAQRPSAGPAVVAVPAATPAPCDATSMDSPPAKAWLAAQGWRYATAAEATQAYLTLVNNGQGGSPWADWYLPTPSTTARGVLTSPPITTLPVGTRFQMALAVGQKPDAPGSWGTFDYISDVHDVREFLAVIHKFKAQVDQVVTYEVTQVLPVFIGPVGPQVDAETCEYFPGRWSQFMMIPKWDQQMSYLKIIEVRTIQ